MTVNNEEARCRWRQGRDYVSILSPTESLISTVSVTYRGWEIGPSTRDTLCAHWDSCRILRGLRSIIHRRVQFVANRRIGGLLPASERIPPLRSAVMWRYYIFFVWLFSTSPMVLSVTWYRILWSSNIATWAKATGWDKWTHKLPFFLHLPTKDHD